MEYEERPKHIEEPESMLEPLLLGGVISIVVTIVTALLVFKAYQRTLSTTIIQQQGWEHAQEARQQQWQLEQAKRLADTKKELLEAIQQVRQEWQAWEQEDATRAQTLEQQYITATTRVALENELGHLPYLEDASLPSVENQRRRSAVSSDIPSQLQEADLVGRDLSRRFLSGANLRGAHLAQANLFMADLSDACLADADLSDADLSGANLMGADLRGANLTGANVLVADLNNAILFDAHLTKTRNLTVDQIQTTMYDRTTQFDANIDITLPRLPSVPKAISTATQTPPVVTAPPVTPPQTTTAAYDIVRAQSLDALTTELITQPSILSFPETLPATPQPELDVTEENASPWSSLPSEDTLRLLEDLNRSPERAERHRAFDVA